MENEEMTLDELRKRFLDTSFCPARLIRGREETEVVFTSLATEHEPATHDDYQSNLMYNVLNYMDGRQTKATRHFADWGRKADAEFIRDVVEWFRKESGDEH